MGSNESKNSALIDLNLSREGGRILTIRTFFIWFPARNTAACRNGYEGTNGTKKGERSEEEKQDAPFFA